MTVETVENRAAIKCECGRYRKLVPAAGGGKELVCFPCRNKELRAEFDRGRSDRAEKKWQKEAEAKRKHIKERDRRNSVKSDARRRTKEIATGKTRDHHKRLEPTLFGVVLGWSFDSPERPPWHKNEVEKVKQFVGLAFEKYGDTDASSLRKLAEEMVEIGRTDLDGLKAMTIADAVALLGSIPVTTNE